ncbi:MAG: hypothetical protein FIA99_17945 [Ruminiclostridium sp.]|nr:hypothetical protein [Ruminiclostridium sp.]
MNKWECLLKLDSKRDIISGSEELLAQKVRAGSDYRVATVFKHNEHIDTASYNNEIIEETGDFTQSVLIDDKWSAAFMTLRQPVSIPYGFGNNSTLSLFLYNQNGQQALARLSLDGKRDEEIVSTVELPDMPKMHVQRLNDQDTPAPSKNFIYDFDEYRFLINDSWEEVYSNDSDGKWTGGSIDRLAKLCREGYKIKVAVKGLFCYIWNGSEFCDEVFIHAGSSYYYTQQKLMITNTHPFVSIPAEMPLVYKPGEWNYCWAVVRSDGYSVIRMYNPFECKFSDKKSKFAIRWFAQDVKRKRMNNYENSNSRNRLNRQTAY